MQKRVNISLIYLGRSGVGIYTFSQATFCVQSCGCAKSFPSLYASSAKR